MYLVDVFHVFLAKTLGQEPKINGLIALVCQVFKTNGVKRSKNSVFGHFCPSVKFVLLLI